MMCLNIGEALVTRDHNIDRKEIAVRRRRVGAFSSSRCRREHDTVSRGRSGSDGLAACPPRLFWDFSDFWDIANLAGKRIPLFPKML
jgi:hypothetical protein